MIRHYPTDEDERKDIERLNVEPWMVDTLKRNPSYVSWGNHEDYMIANDGGWREPAEIESWGEIWEQDQLNEVVNAYYFLHRESVGCTSCDQSGRNRETKKIADDWYDFARTGRRWCDSLTQDEVDALLKRGRLSDFLPQPYMWDEEKNSWLRLEGQFPNSDWVTSEPPPPVLAETVNARARSSVGMHDAMNSWICIRVRAERLGVYGTCSACDGHGYIYTEPTGQLRLQLWWIHPRKGAARGLIVRSIQQADLPKIELFFQEALTRTEQRMRGLAGK